MSRGQRRGEVTAAGGPSGKTTNKPSIVKHAQIATLAGTPRTHTTHTTTTPRRQEAAPSAAPPQMSGIEAHLGEHPPLGSAISEADLRYAVGRLLLLRDQGAKIVDMQTDEVAKFAALLYVLLLQEYVEGERDLVIGFGANEVRDIITECRQQIGGDAIVSQVKLLDAKSNATALLTQQQRQQQQQHEMPFVSEGGIPTAARSKITRRMQILLVLCSASMVAYAATFSLTAQTESASNLVQRSLGEQANNVVQLAIVFAICTFLATINPQVDLDTPLARKYIGPMLAVSNVIDTFVVSVHVRALAMTRTEAARSDYDRRVCLHTQYAVTAFFYCWGVIYPTIVWFRLKNTWVRLRTGLVIDACVFLATIGLLYAHGEDKYPPSDSPLAVALFGRPLASLLAAATFNLPARRRIAEWGAAAGLYHVSLNLNDLRREEARRVLRQMRLGAPVAAGNVSVSSGTSVEMGPVGGQAAHGPEGSDETADESDEVEGKACSHYTAKDPFAGVYPGS